MEGREMVDHSCKHTMRLSPSNGKMENQMGKKMEHERETGYIKAI